MKPTLLIAVLLLAAPMSSQPRPDGCCGGAGSQDGSAAPISSNPIVEIRGAIAEVQIASGQGMPSLTIKQGSGSTKVYLGAMHYLISENFSPKAGQQVVVKGYKSNDSIIAIQVNLPAEQKTIKFRDEKGWPLWRGGPMRGTRGKSPQ
jgi:hypothetical protein